MLLVCGYIRNPIAKTHEATHEAKPVMHELFECRLMAVKLVTLGLPTGVALVWLLCITATVDHTRWGGGSQNRSTLLLGEGMI